MQVGVSIVLPSSESCQGSLAKYTHARTHVAKKLLVNLYACIYVGIKIHICLNAGMYVCVCVEMLSKQPQLMRRDAAMPLGRH